MKCNYWIVPLVDAKDLKPNIFYQPRISNLESGDAFCVISTAAENNATAYKLIILQITVAEKHSVKIKGLQNIIAAYSEEIQANIIEKLLVFVTPHHGKLNSCQAYVNRDGKTPKKVISPHVSEFKQYVTKYLLIRKDKTERLEQSL